MVFNDEWECMLTWPDFSPDEFPEGENWELYVVIKSYEMFFAGGYAVLDSFICGDD